MGHNEISTTPACTSCAEDAAVAKGGAVVYRIDNMDCPTEEALIRNKLSAIAGIESLGFNLMGRTLTVTHTLASPQPIERALSEIGMNAKRVGARAPGEPAGTVARYRIDNMDCPTEEGLIRQKLSGMAGIKGLEFNLMQRTLAVTHELASTALVEQALAQIGMNAEPIAQRSAGTRTTLAIPKMDCPTEEGLIRSKLKDMPGIAGLEFNLVQRSLTLTHEPAALQQASAASPAGTVARSICGAIPSRSRAAAIACGSSTWWWTVSSRPIRLNSSLSIPGMRWSVLRISCSSVGQSMLSMR